MVLYILFYLCIFIFYVMESWIIQWNTLYLSGFEGTELIKYRASRFRQRFLKTSPFLSEDGKNETQLNSL